MGSGYNPYRDERGRFARADGTNSSNDSKVGFNSERTKAEHELYVQELQTAIGALNKNFGEKHYNRLLSSFEYVDGLSKEDVDCCLNCVSVLDLARYNVDEESIPGALRDILSDFSHLSDFERERLFEIVSDEAASVLAVDDDSMDSIADDFEQSVGDFMCAVRTLSVVFNFDRKDKTESPLKTIRNSDYKALLDKLNLSPYKHQELDRIMISDVTASGYRTLEDNTGWYETWASYGKSGSGYGYKRAYDHTILFGEK